MIEYVRDSLEELLTGVSMLVIAGAIALAYAVLDVAQGFAALVLSAFEEGSDDPFGRGTLSLAIGDRALEFSHLVRGVVTLAVVLAALLFVFRQPRDPPEDALDAVH